PMAWYTEGEQTGTVTNGTVLADTGPLANADPPILVTCTASVTAALTLQRRNAANDATISAQAIRLSANTTQSFAFGPVHLEDQERIRIVTTALIDGAVQASITYV